MDSSASATLLGAGLGALAFVLVCVVCRIWRRNRYYRKVQKSLDEEEAAFQECARPARGRERARG